MKIKKYNQHFAFIDDLIRRKATGTPQVLSQKLGVSERQVKRIIQELKEDDFPIKYCHECKSYYYTEPVQVRIEIKVGDFDLLHIKGGNNNFLFPKEYNAYNSFLTGSDILCPRSF